MLGETLQLMHTRKDSIWLLSGHMKCMLFWSTVSNSLLHNIASMAQTSVQPLQCNGDLQRPTPCECFFTSTEQLLVLMQPQLLSLHTLHTHTVCQWQAAAHASKGNSCKSLGLHVAGINT